MGRWTHTLRAAGWLALLALALLLPATLLPGPAAAAGEGCPRCHRETPRFSAFHDPARIGCTSCHGGDPAAAEKAAAHAGLEAYPGRAATAERRCGQSGCHAETVQRMRNSIMNTLAGMIELTRDVLGEPPHAGQGLPLAQRLVTSGADSYLRKLCVSCHLGNERRNHAQSLQDRGGGCSACHLHTYPAPADGGEAAPAPGAAQRAPARIHPTLTLRIPDERCFGCHSRSSRVALNYVGLAEVDAPPPGSGGHGAELFDGRPVEARPPDLHSTAGLSCVDCHTAAEVMGTGESVTRLAQQLDVRCEDCHAPTLRERAVRELPVHERVAPTLSRWANPDLARGVLVVTQRRGSALWNVFRQGGQALLRTKEAGKELPIPAVRPGRSHEMKGHERLTCSACHDTWAPQCDGCHIAYDPAGQQWDHLLGRVTPGRWIERRWHVRNEAPALGVTGAGQIAPFVPGMSLIAELPGRPQALRSTRYTRVTPHTTQRAGRTCASCHRSEQALGVITGEAAAPWDSSLRVPIGWVARDAAQPGRGLRAGERSLNAMERDRVRRVGDCLECHGAASRLYDNFGAGLAAIAGQRPHPAPDSRAPAP